jgi:hypothetical protein
MSDTTPPATPQQKAAKIARRVYLGPASQTNPLRRGLRATLLGLVTLSLLTAPFAEEEQGSDVARQAGASATASPTVSPSSSPTTSPSSSPAASPTPAPSKEPATTDEIIAQAEEDTALAVLAAVAVKGRAPQTGYDRDLFGPAWADTDRNGCDTRNDILQRDLTGETFKAGTNNCVVMTGALADPYTGQTLTFTKENADAIHIDHVVALSDAWQKGAQSWPAEKRLAFANDPLNLLAVDGAANSSKSDGDAATWLPPNKAYRCAMVARQVAVKAKYELWMTQPERDATARVLASCPQEPAPYGGNPTLAPVAAPPPPPPPAPKPAVPAAPPPPAAPAPAPGGTDSNYGTCKKAKAAGKGPYYQGKDPEYGWYRDADSDGIVCE